MSMQQFVLTGSQGSFTVPSGESRIGSDAACQICLHGEGLLPIHAYLSTDGEKLLIRPASAAGSSSESVAGFVAVNGEPLTGPATLVAGVEVSIGSVKLRLAASRVRTALWNRRWFRRLAWSMGVLALLVAVAYAVLMWVILDERWLKEWLAKGVTEHLLRDETEIGSIRVKPFEGSITIENIKIKDRDNFSGSQRPFVAVPKAAINLEVWPWLRSWGREYRNLRIVVSNPEINIERSKTDGALNIRDIVKKYSQGQPSLDLGLVQLDARLEVKGAKIVLHDYYTNLDSSLEDINIELRQPGAGQPLEIKTCEMRIATAAPAPQGALKLTGEVNLLDASAVIDSATISSKGLHAELTDFDLARFFEHLGYAWAPHGMDIKVVLGKPISGKADAVVKDIHTVWLGGAVRSASLLSIREEGRPPMGNIPMGLTFDLNFSDSARGFLPDKMNIGLLCGADLNNPYLVFGAAGRLNPGGTSEYTVNLECSLQDLLGTDIGRRLGLDGRLGGRLQGTAKLRGLSDGAWKIDAKMESGDAYAMVAHPTDPSKPPVRQPLPLDFQYHASAQPSASGGISELEVTGFKISAPSFEACSEVPGQIKGLDRKGALDAHAKFTLKVKGREFWRDFKPILVLFGFTQPIEEVLDLEVTLVGRNDRVEMAAKGKAARQWHADPAPVRLQTYVEYNRKAATARTPAYAPPYLSLMLEVNAEEAKPLRVRVDAQCQRSDRAEIVALETYAPNDKDRQTPLPGLTIQSDIVALRERFQPYIEGYLASHDKFYKTEANGWLKRYRDTTVTGELEEAGRLVIERMLDPKSLVADQVRFDLNIAAKSLDTRMPHPPSLTGAAPPEKAAAEPWNWKEDVVHLGLRGAYAQRLSDNKEEPDTEKLGIEYLDVRGSIGAFRLTLNDLDLFKLSHLRGLANQTWTDCLAELTVAGQLDPPACQLARSLHVLQPDNPLSGTLALQIGFNRQKDALNLQRFEFRQTEQKQNLLANLDMTGALVRVRELSSRLFPAGDDTPFSEQVATFLQDAGPAALLDHLGDELTINAAQLETGPFLVWLCKDYKSGARKPPPLLAGLLANDWLPEGTWKATGVKLARKGEPRERKWSLVGGLRTDFTCYGPPREPGAPRTGVFSLSHDWALQVGLSVDQNSNFGLQGNVLLDKAFIAASFPNLRYEYKKPAAEPCEVALADCWYSHGRKPLAHIGKLTVSGKPVGLELKELDVDYTRGPAGSFQLGEAIIAGGPLPCVVSITKLEPDADMLNARVSAPTADMAYLSSLLNLPPALSATGTLRDLNVSYKGSIAGLRAQLESDTAALAQRLKLEPTDPRLNGLNPQTDALVVDASAQDVRLKASAQADTGAELRLSGKLRLTARDLTGKQDQERRNFSVELAHQTPQGTLKQTFTTPALQIASADARLNLARAFRAPGVPLSIQGDVEFSSGLNPATWLAGLEVLAAARSATLAPAPAPADEYRLAALEKLEVSGSAKVPQCLVNGEKLPAMDARQLTFKNLKCSVPQLTTELYGGKLALPDSDFDLTKAVATRTGEMASLKGVAFRLRPELTDADLAQMLGDVAPGTLGYSVSGRVSARGNLDGTDFSGMDRHTWDGAIKFKVTGLTVKPPRRTEAAPAAVPPWTLPFAGLGQQLLGAFLTTANTASACVLDLVKDLPVVEALKPLNGWALALQTYLARAFGVEVEQLEFEPVTPTVMVTKGFAIVDRCQLIGRGKCEGLDLEIASLKVNLAEKTFADEVRIYPVALPKSARAALNLDKWPAAVQQDYLRDMRDGKIALRVQGPVAAPTIRFPWATVRSYGRRALFGEASISDLDGLEKARQHLLTTWGRTPQELAAAAATGDRMGAGLPSTAQATKDRETVLDHE
ncbi:MAG: hypothetical protein NTW87_30075 [Planctomycetota bacterium]|nr:hypothetical protein [Planctomycetota bacterium]